MKKVAIFGPVQTDTYFGGVATFDENLALGFERLGYKAVIISRQKSKPAQTKNGIKIIDPNIATKSTYDIAIASLSYGKHLPKISAKKKIYFLHGFYYFSRHGLLKTVGMILLQKHYAKSCQYVISNSQLTYFINRYIYDIQSCGSVRLGVSYNFINSLRDNRNIERRCKSVLYVGRLDTQIKVGKLLEAIKLLGAENGQNAFSLTVIGDGKGRRKLEEYAKSEKINATFIGKVDQDDIAQYYLKNEIFISLNPAEPFGITFCEALLAGCKIICPKTGGQNEFLGDYSDRTRTVEWDSPNDIAAAIKALSSADTISPVEPGTFLFENTADEIMRLVKKSTGNSYRGNSV